MFTFLRGYQADFQSVYLLYMPTSCVWAFWFLHILAKICMLCFQILDILVGISWDLTLVLICTSLKAPDVEHLFVCLFAICRSLMKWLFKFCTGSSIFEKPLQVILTYPQDSNAAMPRARTSQTSPGMGHPGQLPGPPAGGPPMSRFPDRADPHSRSLRALLGLMAAEIPWGI